MRSIIMTFLAGTAILPSPARAADALKFGPAPAWVRQQAIPAAKPSDAPVAILLHDEQIALEPGKVTSFSEGALKIQTAQGLAAGNLSLVWQPSTDTVTVNKLQIRRGDKVIDVLASGQTFTVLRRETNLDAATLDGTLTATIQPEGLQEGDIIDFATTIERSDPVFKGHLEAMFGSWAGLPIQSAHAALNWPQSVRLSFRQTSDLPAARRSVDKGMNRIDVAGEDVQPLVPPKGAPTRFTVGRLAEASDFASWDDVVALMLPLFKNAAAIPASGTLHDEVEKIRAASADPKVRAAQALALVQNRIRYVALLMGQGGYVPASAEQTWSRRFGDCKGKTALLLGILTSLRIDAEPVLVQSKLGDIIADRLPMVSLFNHVLLRAHIGGKDYWLDGTRTGDTDLDSVRIPDFGWGLPLAQRAQLVHLVPKPLDFPESEVVLSIDASSGIRAPATATAEHVVRGDAASALHSTLSAFSDAQRDEFFDAFWKSRFDFIKPKSTSYAFNKATGELHLEMNGEATLDWSGGYFHIPDSTVGYHADFDRPPGPLHDAPVAVSFPNYKVWTTKLRLPPGFLTGRDFGSVDVHETLAGIEYKRTSTVSDNVLTVRTSERSIVPEIPYQEAEQAERRLTALDDEDVAVPLPTSYTPTSADISAQLMLKPASAEEYFRRGRILMDAGRYAEAIADFTAALAADPKDGWSLANRGLIYALQKNDAAAEKDLSAAEAIAPDNFVAMRGRGLIAEQKAEWAKAIAYYTRSLAKDPGNSAALGHRAICEAALGKSEDALVDSGQALKSDLDWVDLRILRANLLFVEGKTAAVADEARLLAEQNPTSDYAFVGAGKIYALIGRRDDAMKAFDRALAIKPQAYIYLNRAQSRPFSDRSGRLADLDAALKLNPRDVDTLSEKAEELASAGDYKGALQIYDQVTKEHPDASYYRVRRAVMLFKTGDSVAANELFAKARAEATKGADFNTLCWAKATAGILLEKALEDCKEALKREPGNASFIDSLALVELRLGRLDEAITDYGRAIALKSGAASFMGRAIAYARKGDPARAEADRAQALRINPDEQTRFEEFGLGLDGPPVSLPTASAQQSPAGKA